MDLTTLAATLTPGGDGSLRIDFSAPDAPRSWRFLVPYAGGGPLALREVAGPPARTAEGLTVLGTGAGGPFAGMRVEVKFRAGAGPGAEIDVEITATSAQEWWVAGAFPALRDTIFAGLSFVPPPDPNEDAVTLVLRSRDGGAGAPRGMTVEGDGSPQTFSALGFIAGGASRYPLRGELDVELVRDPSFNPRGFPRDQANLVLPRFSLLCDLPAKPLPSLPFGVDGVHCELEVAPSYDMAFHGWRLDSALWVGADLLMGAGRDVRIPVEAQVGGARLEEVVLRARLGAALATSLRGLASLAGATLSAPIGGLSPDDPVDLASLELALELAPTGAKLRRIHGRVQARELRWPLIEGFITLDAIDLDFSVVDPFQDRSRVRMEVSGLVGIGKTGTLALSAAVDRDAAGAWSPVFRGGLVPGTRLSLAEVFQRFTGVQNPDLPELGLYELDLEVAPAAGRASGMIELRGIWELGGGPVPVALENVLVSFEREGELSAAFRIDGAFRVGGTFVYLIAEYEGVARGWTFSGSTVPARPLPAGSKLDALLPPGVSSLPAVVQGLELRELGVRFNTATGDFSFLGTVAFPFSGAPGAAALTVHADLTRAPGGGSQVSFGGRLVAGGHAFAVAYEGDLLVATYDGASAGGPELRDVLAAISPTAADLVPRGLRVGLERAQLAIARGDAGTRALFAVELGAGVDLAKLPLVGSAFEPGQALTVVVQLVVAGGRFSADEVRRLNRHGAPGATKLPEADVDPTAGSIQVRTALRVGGANVPFGAPLEWPTSPAGGASPGPVPAQPSAAAAPAAWFPIQQAFGPFHFERVGIGVTRGAQGLALLLDASLQLGGLTLTLAGLRAEVAFADLGRGDLQPRFGLDGLGVEYASGDLRIGGALLRVPVPGAPERLRFDGAVAIQYRDVGIIGVGSYVDDPLSLFLFALVDYPLGGPAFFSVEGLAFGFGYNRALTIPPLEQVSTFPLVALARAPRSDLTPAAVVEQLAEHLVVAEGEHFVAAGVKFNSFRVLEGAILVAASFGKQLALDMAGTATLVSPPPSAAPGAPSLVKAELAIRARYRPDEGDLRVQGGLMPGAYLFAGACHLTGGFAFSAWFEDGGGAKAGDFVLTLGGYHTAFQAPAHYPRVPRLALNWRVSEELSIKAEAYFALTPSAIMAGGRLRGDWQSDDLRAWFIAGVDCLAAWLPYRYQADLFISIGVTYDTWCTTFTADLTARLHVEGPPFSGTAHVNVWIFSFDLEFTAGGGARPPPLTWPKLRESQLPAKVLTASAREGKVAHHGKRADRPANNRRDHLGVVNPRELCLFVHSAIPVTGGTALGVKLPSRSGDARLGIAPLDVQALKAEAGVSIWRGTADVSAAFSVEISEEALPTALWGRSSTPDVRRAAETVKGRTGFTIRPKVFAPLATLSVPGSAPPPTDHSGQVKPPAPSKPFVSGDGDARGGVQRPDTRAARNKVLDVVLPGVECDWTGLTVDALRSTPRTVKVEA